MVDFPTRIDGEVLTAEQLNSYLQAIEDNDAAITAHAGNNANPHNTTKAQVGLGNVDNTSDANKPISTATQAALDGKANTSHTHAVTDMTATGTRSSSTYLRGDNTWATPTNTTYTAISQAEAENSASTTSRLVTGQRMYQAVLAHAPVKAADLATKANVSHTHVVADLTDFTTAVGSHADVAANTAARHSHSNKAVLDATTASYTTAEETKLAGIAAGATVTNAANVDAAGAVMNTDTTTAAMAFVVDEDAMTSNSATKVPTQQSVKAYVDSGLSGKANTSHSHAIADVTNLQTTLDGKAAASHTHTIANVTGLQTALDGKAASSHTHAATDITSGTLNIARIPTGTTSSTVALGNHTHTVADVTSLQSALDGKAASAHTHNATTDLTATGTKNSTTFLRGDNTWAVPPNSTYNTLTQAQVENAADTNAGLVTGQRLSQAVLQHAPVKTADLAGKADASHVHAAGDITSGTLNIARIPTGTTSSTVALGNHTHAEYAATSHTHAIADVTNLQTTLDGKAASSHTHVATTDLTATGTKSSSTYLRGDNTWATPPNTTYSLATQAEVENAASTTARLVSGQRLAQAVAKHAPVKTTDLATKADAVHDHGIDYIWGGSFLTGSPTRMPIGITVSNGKAYNNLLAGGSGGYWGTAESVARSDHQHQLTSALVSVIDGDGVVLSSGFKGDLHIPFNCIVTKIIMQSDVSGSIQLDVWKTSGIANHPGSGGTNLGSTYISGAMASSTNVGWGLSDGDNLSLAVWGISNIRRLTVTFVLARGTDNVAG